MPSKWALLALALMGPLVLPLLFLFERTSGASLEDVKQEGILRALTTSGPTTYFEGADGPRGFEHDLLRGFAGHLGVTLELDVVDRFASVLPRLLRGDAHLAAAGITITPARQKIVHFSRPYQEITQQVIYRRGSLRPRKPADLVGREVEVVAGSSYVEQLQYLKVEFPELAWTEAGEKGPEELLVEVAEGRLELTIADSNVVAVLRPHYPRLGIAFTLKKKDQLAWAFSPHTDESLLAAADQYLESLSESGDLARLIDAHYGAVSKFDYVNIARYRSRIMTDLEKYKPYFLRAQAETGIEWRLLAAQAYQESRWNPEAVSPTGVRGFMQLTRVTAKRMKVQDRTDLVQSIMGGAHYLREMMDRLPKRITEPDRTWLALAAYNVGLGHLADARKLTEKLGKDPDSWVDVRQHFPLLTQPKWYRQAKHGYVRGYEPVSYVNRIRSYYQILKRMDPPAPEPNEITVEAPVL